MDHPLNQTDDNRGFSLKENTLYIEKYSKKIYFVTRQVAKGVFMGDWSETYDLFSVSENMSVIYIMAWGEDFEEL
jgi:hypothetical protein